MANKKSKNLKKTKTITKTTKNNAFDATFFGKGFVALALVITALMFGLFYYMGQSKTHEEAKKLEAFKSLANIYVQTLANEDTGEAVEMTDIGITEDDDLYIDVVRTKYTDHVPMSNRAERIHFQCRDHESKEGCAYAVSYEDWEDTSEEYRTAYREYIDLMEESVEKANNASTEAEKETIKKEYQERAEKLLEIINSNSCE